MPSDGIVTARLILRVASRIQRDRGRQAMQQLDDQEPELSEYVLEQLSDLHHRLWAMGLSERRAQALYRRLETLVLTAVTAQRLACGDLLEGLTEQTPPAKPPASNGEAGDDAAAS